MGRRFAVAAVLVVGLVVVAGCVETSGSRGLAESPTVTGTVDETVQSVQTSAAGPTPTPETPTSGNASANGTLEVHFINVGQSASTLLVGPTNETMLIDTGDWQDDGEYVLGYLRNHGIERIDHLVVSHADADHIGGNAAVIEYFETEADGVGTVYDPGIAASTDTYEEYLDAVEAHDVTLYETREGDTLSFEGVSVDVLGPPDPYLANRARNENSIVLRVSHGNASFLFTGDAEDDQERYLVEEYRSALGSTVLKAGHHGSATSTGGPLLDAVGPSVAVVSSAYDSRYGHPDVATLRRLANRSITTYWTATHGNVVLRSDGDRVRVYTQQSAPTDPLALRDGDPVEPGTSGPVEFREAFGASGTVTPRPTVATDGGTPTTAAGERLTVAEVHADAAGDDRENLNDEYVVFENAGEESLALGGWTVRDEADHTYAFPDGFTLDPGETVTLHTGSGTDNATHLYWGSGTPVWNNGGDTVVVSDADGDVVLREEYS